MDDLCGNHVLITLNIAEGRGFEFLQNSFYLEATLKTCKIESDVFLPQANPTIYTELVWETEKRQVRKLRSCHVSVRIDCVVILDNNEKEKLGFIMLNLRSARAISSKTNLFEEPKWYRLLGLSKDYKQFRPELALSLTIKDQGERNLSPRNVEPCALKEVELSNTQLIPLVYLDGGLIQLGNESIAHKRYVFKVVIRRTSNLDLLLPEELVFNQNNDKYNFTINCFGVQVEGKTFSRNIHDEITINEEMFFKIFCNVELLNLYFQESEHFTIDLCCGQNILGHSQMDLKDFVSETYMTSECSYEKQLTCDLLLMEDNSTPVGENGRRPTATIEVVLLRNETSSMHFELSNTVSSESLKSDSDFKLSISAGGDRIRDTRMTKTEEVLCAGKESAVREIVPRSILSIFKSELENSSDSFHTDILDKKHESFHRFCLMVVLKSVTLRKPMEPDEYLFKFKHPKVHNVLTIHCDIKSGAYNEVIQLNDVLCSLHFISNLNNIFPLFTIYSPSISVCSPSNNFKTEELHVYTELLSEKNNNCDYLAILSSDTDKDDLICDLDVNIKYLDLGTNLRVNKKQNEFDLEPCILDECFCVKTLEEWQEWRIEQEAQFKQAVQNLERQTLEKLENEWSRDRSELELKLKEGIEKCSSLSEELKLATTEMKLKKMQLDNHSICNLTNIENIEMRVTKMLEEEKNRDLEKVIQEKEFLQQKITQLEDEKQELKDKLEKKQKELENINQTTLTKEQTTCLLQEVRCLEQKYFEAIQEKTFFKEQWRKAAKEVHLLKEEKQEQIRLDLHKKKEELSLLSIASSDNLSDTPRDGSGNYEVLGYLEYFPGQYYSTEYE